MRAKRRIAVLASCALATSGCYLAHVAVGQARLLRARQPIERVLADPSTDPELRERLAVVQRARIFAADLGLEVHGQYTSYVPWPGDRIVTTVVATRPGEVEPAGFWFPVVGRVPYKGFFDPARAAAEAARLRDRDYDTCELAVPAYSTLGWLDDPVTGPMLRGDEGRLVETILHELVHATVYVRDHADWNEGIANFIGEEASVAFYRGEAREADARARRTRVEDERRLADALLALRREVAALYADEPAGAARTAERARIEERGRESIAARPLASRDARRLADSLRLNDACLAIAATYSGDTPRYAEVLARLDGDLVAFVARMREAARAPDPGAAFLAP
jgi:predicted aminopeptidase